METNNLRQYVQRVPARISAIAVVLFPIRMFLGFGWLRAGIEKMIDGTWWSGDDLRAFLIEQEGAALPFMERLVDVVFEPFAEIIALSVMLAQLVVGVCVITGRKIRPALWMGVTMNLVFVALGAVDPSVFYLVIQLALLAAIAVGALGGSRRRTPNGLAVGAMVGVAIGLAPLVTTLHPADVIHDPALILITVALLGAATESLQWFARPRDEVSISVAGSHGRWSTRSDGPVGLPLTQ